MPFRNLRHFIDSLERSGDLRRIGAEVDPHLEITAFADRAVKQGGPALFFECPVVKVPTVAQASQPANPSAKGAAQASQPGTANLRQAGKPAPLFPVVVNLFASRARMHRMLGTENPGEITERFLSLLDQGGGAKTILDKLRLLPKLADLGRAAPRTVSSGPCQEVIREGADPADPARYASFAPLPVLKCWPLDGGPTLTLPMVFTRDPDTGAQNCGMYRMQVYDERTSGMHWHLHKDGARHARRAQERGERLPVAVALGGPPLATFASMCPVPPDLDEMLFAGLIGGEPIDMVKCRTCDILVPAEAEIVLEGYVDPTEKRIEGPFGDHTGFYSLADEYPVFHLTCLTHRRDAIYPATVVGRPPMEDCYMGDAVEALFFPIIRKQLPEIVDLHMPFVGVFHNLVLVSIRKAYPGHARKVMHALWGLGQMMFSKIIVVLDADANLRDGEEVVWKALNHIDPERDIEFVLGPTDALDHASRLPHYGSHAGVDATKKWPGEGFTRPWPDEMRLPEEVVSRVDNLWNELGLGEKKI
jgi:4-hydroxy-3-polyprenylbenzoate decarboxylase